MTAKDALLDIAQKLPDDASFEGVMEELLLRKKVEDGRKDLKEGNTLTQEQVRQELQRWVK
ncbi:hypothetical protein [Anatilimnocola floriformis]|uniref:hypothetical protein n=1 Tax=Anatilimnocola floriformis TaxID=2948575 RepID=UPI0020C531E9|nr:hypothetical protein [Anatilimnocola floriformis]